LEATTTTSLLLQETARSHFDMELQATGHAFQVWSLPFGYFGEVEIVHVIQGLNT
jgi:hypothetical protein